MLPLGSPTSHGSTVEITIDASVLAAAAGALGGVITTAGLAWTKVVRPLRATMERFRLFAEDWDGEPDRPGVPGRLGVMVRLATIEGELRPDHGGSMRDSVNRIESGLTAHLAGHGLIVAGSAPPDGTQHSANHNVIGGLP